MITYRYTLPLCPADIVPLQEYDKVLLTGCLYTARDAAHKKMAAILQKGEKLPLDLAKTALFYCGPSPLKPGNRCGAIGPTTSSRMDVYTPLLLQNGLRVMIGKGERSLEVQKAIRDFGAVYFIMPGGISAYLSQYIVSCEPFLWQELGPEAIYKLRVQEIPVFVGIK